MSIKEIANKMFNTDKIFDTDISDIDISNVPKNNKRYYAVVDPADNILKFFRIKIPDKGKWIGRTLLSIQASSEFHPIKNKEYRDRILNEIKKDPLEASMRYGREIGNCGICGRILTDEVSRQRGIGPICAARIH